MPSKKDLLNKLYNNPITRNFTVRELDMLMNKCNCIKFYGGRGSGVGFIHSKSKRVLQFDEPHPGKELYVYHIKKIRAFIDDIGEKEA